MAGDRKECEGKRRLTPKLLEMFDAEPKAQSDDDFSRCCSGRGFCSSSPIISPRSHSGRHFESGSASPYDLSPWNHPAASSPAAQSPWIYRPVVSDDPSGTSLIGSFVREEGHVYSLAAAGDLLYTGSDSKNIRVWKGCRELSGFKSSSGLVKAIVVAGDRIFTGHQDGKIRLWKMSSKNPPVHKRIGTLPRIRDVLKSSVNPSNYERVRRHRKALWLKHFDAVSCLALDAETGILYSGSWDKTVKVWRISDSKCLESIKAHDDAVNSVATGFGGYLFTGSANGTLKVWRREASGKGSATRHVLVQTLLRQESAVTAIAVAEAAGVVYGGSSDGAVNYWWWEGTGRQLVHGGTLRGHRMAVLCLAATGSLVVSGSADKTLCVWRREYGSGRHAKVAALAGHEGPIKCVVVEEEGRTECGFTCGEAPHVGRRYVIYSGSLDRSIKVWRVLESDQTAKAGDGQSLPSERPGGLIAQRPSEKLVTLGLGTPDWPAQVQTSFK